MPIYTNILKGKNKTLDQFWIRWSFDYDLTMNPQHETEHLTSLRCVSADNSMAYYALRSFFFKPASIISLFPRKVSTLSSSEDPFQILRNYGGRLPKCHLKWCLPNVKCRQMLYDHSCHIGYFPHELGLPWINVHFHKKNSNLVHSV